MRRRVRADDVDDIVQTVLVEALGAQPSKTEELKRWLTGSPGTRSSISTPSAPRGSGDRRGRGPAARAAGRAVLAAWATQQIGGSREGVETLGWMAREGDGEKLESIAREEKVPPATLRQRVSRMRRALRRRWVAELALVAALGVLAFALYRWLRTEPAPIAEEPAPLPSSSVAGPPRHAILRVEAERACDAGRFEICKSRLDEARALDPDGEQAPAIRALRERAEDGLTPRAPVPETEEKPESRERMEKKKPESKKTVLPREKISPEMKTKPRAVPRTKSAPMLGRDE